MAGKRTLWRLLIGALAVSTAACGSSSGEANETQDTSLVGAKQDVDDALGSSTTAAPASAGSAPTTVEEWEALWTEERAAVVAKIEANGWGWDQTKNVVTGPGGMLVDLSACLAAGWDPYGGLSDGVINIGQTIAQSGTLADYGNIGIGERVLYDTVNEAGGITDSTGKTWKIETELKDDSYDPAKTVPLVDELLDSSGSFLIQTLGSSNTLKVYDKLNQRCVPNPYVMTGHPAWGDPVNHPWTWGHPLPYNIEALLWGGMLEKTFADDPDGIKVAALIIQNDFGKAYELGFRQFLATTELKVDFVFERLDPTAPTVTNQMTTLVAQNPDVFIAMTAGTSCTQTAIEAAGNGLKSSGAMMITSQGCKGLNFVGKDKVGGDGSAPDGWWIVGAGAKDFNDDTLADDVYVTWAREQLEAAGFPSEGSSQLGNGFYYGWPVLQTLKIAAELPGGLSRPNFLLAARTMDMTHPTLFEGIKYNMSGNDDAYPLEGSEISKFSAADQSWIIQPEFGVIDLSGKSAPCAWDQATSVCK